MSNPKMRFFFREPMIDTNLPLVEGAVKVEGFDLEVTDGDCYDNSPMESFWGSMQIELLNRQRWTTVVELSVAMADYIENFYNPRRRHSALSYFTPEEFENLQLNETQSALS